MSEMVPVTKLGITETVSTTATSNAFRQASQGTTGTSLADFYYGYDTQLLSREAGFPSVTEYSGGATNGDNVSLYMLDPNYGSGNPAGRQFTESNYLRPLAPAVRIVCRPPADGGGRGSQYEDGGRPPGNDSIGTQASGKTTLPSAEAAFAHRPPTAWFTTMSPAWMDRVRLPGACLRVRPDTSRS